MKVKYTVEKSKTDDNWVIWRNTETERGFGCRGIFSDISKRKCYEVKKEIENTEKDFNEVIKKYEKRTKNKALK